MLAAGILGVLMIAAGVLLLLRAATSRWPHLVATLVNLDAGSSHGAAQPPARRSSRRPGDPPSAPKSFDEELAALNDQMGRGREHE